MSDTSNKDSELIDKITAGVFKDLENKGKVADKVRSGQPLNNKDRRDIYKYLTGLEIEVKGKGRPPDPSLDSRYAAFALDVLIMTKVELKQPKQIYPQLAKKHNLPESLKDKTGNSTFYSALERGIEALRAEAMQPLNLSRGYSLGRYDFDDNSKTFTLDGEPVPESVVYEEIMGKEMADKVAGNQKLLRLIRDRKLNIRKKK